jgi:hypothetical protein
MLQILYHVTYETLDDDEISYNYQELSQSEIEKLLRNILSLDAPLPVGPPPFKSIIFPEVNK